MQYGNLCIKIKIIWLFKLIWLINNHETQEEVIENWDMSYVLRVQDCINKTYKNVNDILTMWPILKLANAYLLVTKVWILILNFIDYLFMYVLCEIVIYIGIHNFRLKEILIENSLNIKNTIVGIVGNEIQQIFRFLQERSY